MLEDSYCKYLRPLAERTGVFCPDLCAKEHWYLAVYHKHLCVNIDALCQGIALSGVTVWCASVFQESLGQGYHSGFEEPSTMKDNKKKTCIPLCKLLKGGRRAATNDYPLLKRTRAVKSNMVRKKIDLSPKEGLTHVPTLVEECTNVEKKKKKAKLVENVTVLNDIYGSSI